MTRVTTCNHSLLALVSFILLVATTTTTTTAVGNDSIVVKEGREGEGKKKNSMLRRRDINSASAANAANTQKNRILDESDGDDYDYYESECDWVEESPEERCALKDPQHNFDTLCKFCPGPCSAAGYSQDEIDNGTCFKSRQLHELRFNKLPPYNPSSNYHVPSDDYVGGIHKKVYPLLPEDYPLSWKDKNDLDVEGLVKTIKKHTRADSVIVNNDHELYGRKRFEYYNNKTQTLNITTADKPIYPGQEGYWEQLEHVVDVQIKRNNGDDSDSIVGKGNIWPTLWSDWSLNQIADAVRGEYPVFHQQNCLESFWSSPDGFKFYKTGKPFRSNVDFVGYQVRLADINAWAFHRVAPVNFMLKWTVGMPRPEEVAWLIYTDQLTTEKDGVPATIVSKIKSMNLLNSHDFTRYKSSGCPTHPSWPAMHSAGSTMSFWLPAVAKLTGEQYCESLRVDYAVSYGRTVAGVHYEQDNIAGLNIGQNMIREDLPEYLSTKYGYDIDIIRNRLDAISFDWKDFDPEQCTINGVDAGDFLITRIPEVLEVDDYEEEAEEE